MSSDIERADLPRLVADLDERAALDVVHRRVLGGDDPLAIFAECQEGMRRVGVEYEAGVYYLSGLVMAGEIFRQVIDIARPSLNDRIARSTAGHVVLGTVQGDIHDIGKNILQMLLSCHGFTVHDLGVDVAPECFLAACLDLKPQVVGLSALLSSAYKPMRSTVELIRREGQLASPRPWIVIGGGRIDAGVCKFVGADNWESNAMNGVRLCQALVQRQPPSLGPDP